MKLIAKNLFVIFVVVFVFGLGFVSGCGTIHGVASDIESGSGWVRSSLDNSMEKRADSRISKAEAERQHRLDRATEYILSEKNKANNGDSNSR